MKLYKEHLNFILFGVKAVPTSTDLGVLNEF